MKTAFEQWILQNSYPGRGFLIGRASFDGPGLGGAPSGDTWVIAYWITGRSAASKNRRLVARGRRVATEMVGTADGGIPGLLLYDAILTGDGFSVVGNGTQTSAAFDAVGGKESFQAAFATQKHEPDAPVYTPRITGMLDLRGERAEVALSAVRSSPFDVDASDRSTTVYAHVPPGRGFGLITYADDGDPPPTYRGDPLIFPCEGHSADLADRYWDALPRDRRVALAVMFVRKDCDSELVIRNVVDGS